MGQSQQRFYSGFWLAGAHLTIKLWRRQKDDAISVIERAERKAEEQRQNNSVTIGNRAEVNKLGAND